MNSTNMNSRTHWDFRDEQEILISDIFTREGYVIENANQKYLQNERRDRG